MAASAVWTCSPCRGRPGSKGTRPLRPVAPLTRGSAAARAARTPRGGQPPLTAPGCPAGAARGADTRHSPGDPGGTEPCHGRGRVGLAPGCAPVRRCATGPRRPREMSLPRWDAHGCGDTRGDTPGARADRRGCAGREAAPIFQNCLFLPRDLLVVDIWNMTVTHRDTIRSPDLALGEHSPPPQRGAAQPVGRLSLGPNSGTTAWSPAVMGPRHRHGQEGLKHSGTTNAEAQDGLRSPGNTSVLLEPSSSPPGAAPSESGAGGASPTGRDQKELSRPLSKRIPLGTSSLLHSSHPSIPGT